MIDINKTPIKFRKYYNGDSFEIEISASTTAEDFVEIEKAFYDLHKNHEQSLSIIQEYAEKQREKEREENIRKNPCYYCLDLNVCNSKNKGKKRCELYGEFPF